MRNASIVTNADIFHEWEIIFREFGMKKTSSGLAKPLKQQASQGGRVMRQERQEESLEGKGSAKMASTKGAKKGGMNY